MRLQDDIDFTTLTWVKGELDETLKQARHALEAFVEDPTDASQMRFCATYLHQVQGTLRMVELYGAAMVTEEMEQLATALLNDEIKDRDEAYTVLMRGIVQLPDYLERLQTGYKDIPIVLLPLLNELRAARGEKGLSESVLFSPDLSHPLPDGARGPAQPMAEQELRKHAEQLRSQFQLSLLKWFRNDDPQTHIAKMAQVCDRLVALVTQEEARRLFWIAGGVLEALREGAFEPAPQLKQTIGKVEREIKRLADAGEGAFRVEPPRELTRSLLYYVAHAPTQHGRIGELRRVFKLDSLLPTEAEIQHARGSISGHNRALLDTVAAAIKEDLLRVKDSLDLFMRTQSTDVGALSAQAEVLDRVGDTLGMLGLGVPRRVVVEQRGAIMAIASRSRPPDEAALLDIAGALLYVESSLDDQVQHLGAVGDEHGSDGRALPQAEARRVLEALVKEAQANFAQAKQCFVAFVESNWDHAQLEDVPRLLEEVAGALRILELDEPPRYLAAVRRFTEAELLARRRVPNGQQLDTLADALASLEYYLEALRDHRAGRDKILDVARQRLETLGYWPVPPEGAAGVLDEVPVGASPTEQTMPAEPVVESTLAPLPPVVETAAVAVTVEVVAETPAPAVVQPDVAQPEPVRAEAAPAVAAEEPAPMDEPAPVAAAPDAGALGFEGATDEIDEEIREVFIEEVQEEISNLAELLPVWKANLSHLDSLKPIRRVFHTLKGSGRLVGALTLGEFAWKIENMLNRVLDQTIEPNNDAMRVVSRAYDVLPELLAALRGERSVRSDLERIKDAADQVASGAALGAGALDVAAAAPPAKAEPAAPAPVAAAEPEVSAAAAAEPEVLEELAPESFALPDVELEPAAAEIQPVAAGEYDIDLSAVAAETDAALQRALQGEAAGAAAEPQPAAVADEPVIEPIAVDEPEARGGTPFSIDPVLFDILKAEVAGHLETVDDYVAHCSPHSVPVGDPLLRAVHTMSGAFAMTEVPHITDVVGPLESYIKRLLAQRSVPTAEGVRLIAESAAAIRALMRALDTESPRAPEFPVLAERLAAIRDTQPEPTGPLLPLHPEVDAEEEVHAVDLGAHVGPSADFEASVAALPKIDPREAERREAERAEAARLEAERVEAERAEAARREAQRLEAERAEAARLEAERLEAERAEAARLEAERLEAERAEAARLEAERLEAERAEAARLEAERLEAERAEAARLEAERLEAERAEAARLEAERLEAERAEAARLEAERLEAERAEAARLEAERLEAERLEAERLEAERLEAERLEAERAEAARLEAERLEAERLEAERLEAERAEAARLEAERVESERLAAERREAERLEAERLEAEQLAAERAAQVREEITFDGEIDLGDLTAEPIELLEIVGDDEDGFELALPETADADSMVGLQLEDAGAPIALTEAVSLVGDVDEAELAAALEDLSGAPTVTEAQRSEIEHLEAERLEAERLEAERVEAERVEAERLEAERVEAERIEVERLEAERLEAERLEAERLEAERLEAERVEAERLEAERLEAERVEAERLEAERLEAERLEAERLEAERLEAERLEAERLEAEAAAAQAERDRADAAQREAEAKARELAAAAVAAAAAATATAPAAAPGSRIAGAEADPDPEGPLELPDMDEELLDIFLEEGVDILDHSDGLLAKLREDPADREHVVGLQRDLHTLKGGARMAGIAPIGDLGHAAESLLEAVAEGRRELDPVGLEVLEKVFDRLHGMVTRVGERRALAMPNTLLGYLDALSRGEPLPLPEAEAVAEEPAPATAAEAAPTLESVAAPAPAPVAPAPAAPKPVRTAAPTAADEEEDAGVRAPQEQIRIRADLLDRLVNYAGEVAIYRARLEQQIGAFRGGLTEMDQTTARLREQLRRLEIETEAQIIARYQREGEEGEKQFDPLELDRFSTLQQLSRALAESAADLTSLQVSLDDQTRQYETLLLQQSRVSSELQEGLMRTRMVPFDALVPRLRRILRQTATELGKKAQLKVEGAQGEMDRNVLDRMTAPLEHMLRNALAHGLEEPADRIKAGKPEEGTVRLVVAREASEVVIRIIDDGRGLNREAIRKKAIERGLLDPEAQLSDRDLYGFILEAGFSTAATVSKIAGRGVGMDVVSSEIKQLGGSLHIESEHGRGTEFVIRLPFTLAVTQAVFVKLNETHYAIPITSVQGVARIAPKDLEAQLAGGHPTFEYAGEPYAIYDMGLLLGHSHVRATESLQVPLLLARSGNLRAAICVDQVIGSKEIVVKPTGPQVNSIPGIFGATVMGDGSVVVILDVAPLVRRAAALRLAGDAPAPVAEVEQRRIPLVMVVDDSITMRKVTGRVLERAGYEVLAAKDGVDAIEKMNERVPDVMLLDIEMPRMDGYELATHMRNDLRLRGVPIIMITSRTGEKHRQRAFEIGVDRYLGKPYQEAELMRNVQEILRVGRGGAT